MAKIALFGGAGAVGQSIAAALRQAGQSYRVVGRNRETLTKEFGRDPLAEIVTWNPDDPASVRAAANGIDTIVYLIGVNYWQFELHPVLMTQTLAGAIAENVPQMILIGTVYSYGMPRSPRVTESHSRQPHTFKGKMRKEQEDLLMAADAAGSIHGTILRLPDFYGPGVTKSFLDGIFQAAVNGTRAQVVGPVDTPHEFIYVPDVGPVVLALAREPGGFGRAWNLAGAGTITQRAVAEQAFGKFGRKPQLMIAGKLLLRIVGLFNPLMREMVEMHYLQTNPVIMDDSAIQGLLGPIQKTSYRDGIDRTLEAIRPAQNK